MRSVDRDERGQAVVFIAILMLAMLMMAGLAIDAGQLFVARRTMQEAADAAAYAGAVVLYQGGTTAQASAAATSDAQRNGYVDGVAGYAVTINLPPASGPHAGSLSYLEAIIQGQVKTSLVPGGNLTTVRVRSVGGAAPLNNGYAIMSLNRGSASGAFSTAPNADVHLAGGGIIVNSTNATAAINAQNDPARFTISSPYGISIAGGTGSTWPPGFPVTTGAPQAPDPFAGFPKPSTHGLPICNSLAGCQDASGYQIPGIYTVSLSGAGGTTITLNPGVYILEAGINGSGNADIVSRSDASCQGPPNNCGVFLFNTTTGYPSPGGSCAGITLSGNAASNLQPMPSGTYKNLLIYQDSACAAQMTISGNGWLTASGSIYLPNAAFQFNGNNATLNGSQLVASTVDLQNGNITINFAGASTAQPILPRLAE